MLILYGTRHCHLCEDAEAILNALHLPFQTIDISDDDGLIDRYGIRIPVLKHDKTEIGWPFTISDVQALITNKGPT